MNDTKKLWIMLWAVLFVTFFILGWFGRELYRKVPPIPLEVRTETGRLLMTKNDILNGQQAWQSVGGQQVGSIWGHGAYQAPDWSADWLHREALALRDGLSLKRFGQSYQALDVDRKAGIDRRVATQMRQNTYDPKSGILTLSKERATAIKKTAIHYLALFGSDNEMSDLRESYALHESALPELKRRQDLTAFFFWTAWAATTERKGMSVTIPTTGPMNLLLETMQHLPA